MQLLQAISMLLLGSVVGVLCTLFDVTMVGGPAFFTRFALWALVNVVFATHIRNRWRAMWWSVPFNLGLVESYFLSTSFSFENIARSLAVPFALLALVAPFLVALSWTARHERRNLYGRLLGIVLTLAIVVVSGVLCHGVTVGNVVCALLSLLFMFFIPTHTVAMVELDGENHVARVEGTGVSNHKPRERLSASRQMRQRETRRQDHERRRRQHSGEVRPVREPIARETRETGAPQAKRSRTGAATAPMDARGKQGARVAERQRVGRAAEPAPHATESRTKRMRPEPAQGHNQGVRAAGGSRRSGGAGQRRHSHAPSRPQRTSSRFPRMDAAQRPVVHPAGGEAPARGIAQGQGTARPHKRQQVVRGNHPEARSAAPHPSQRSQHPRTAQGGGRGVREHRGGRPQNQARTQRSQGMRPTAQHPGSQHPSRRRGSGGQAPSARRPR